MKIYKVNDQFSFSAQLEERDLETLADSGVQVIVCNRPDGESADQPTFSELAKAAEKSGMQAELIDFNTGQMQQEHIDRFRPFLAGDNRIHAYCRTGNRSFNLYAATAAAMGVERGELLAQAKQAGIDISATLGSTHTGAQQAIESNKGAKPDYDVVIVGAGSGGVAAAASIQKRQRSLRIAVIDPATEHYYQPGWTMVGGGVFNAEKTRRRMEDVIPKGVTWLRQRVTHFNPQANEVSLENGSSVRYKQLIVSPGLKLDWSAIEGLEGTLGKNGVTSNYRYDLAPYTYELVQSLKAGRAVFTQPPMPIKCAGAPQKAMYLSCDYWQRNAVLDEIDVSFYNAGGVLFGVKDYVPALQSYIERYGVNTHFSHALKSVDGPNKTATFQATDAQGNSQTVSTEFDMLHVCPPQCAPEFVAHSELADSAGWLDVDQYTLRHKRFDNVWGLGDVMSSENAKTMAAVRKQVPVVAENLLANMAGKEPAFGYDGYGSCPLTVERGKIVLAEFGYGGKLLPSFPDWLINGTRPTRAAWILKADILPGVYWHAMLKGREWLAHPRPLEAVRN